MNIPRLPSPFTPGPLSADKMNEILEWMRKVNEILPTLEISAGSGVKINKSSSGTVISAGATNSGSEATPPHPFHVRVIYDGTNVSGIAISGGGVFITHQYAVLYYGENGSIDYELFIPNRNSSFYKKPEIKHGNPVGLSLYLVTQGEDEGEFRLSAYDPEQDNENPNLFVKIAEFKAGNNGLVLVSQILRSDIFLTRSTWIC